MKSYALEIGLTIILNLSIGVAQAIPIPNDEKYDVDQFTNMLWESIDIKVDESHFVLEDSSTQYLFSLNNSFESVVSLIKIQINSEQYSFFRFHEDNKSWHHRHRHHDHCGHHVKNVPEPGQLALLSLGLPILGITTWRRKKVLRS